ncbi:UNVERIFIED_CONTAM: hypothetical protein Scaly_1908900 [Sesamum calycinum]|uniref:SWIM-type domain-containing protein n=1 Tax=Sesamum calycinum TaxID=2727403 RepID=A0AAW2NGS1_9LAMI
MSLRNLQLLDFPNPKYDKYGLDRFVTIILYHGGEVKHSPIAEFVGGNQSKFDFVDVEDMCISYLNGLGSSNPIAVVGDEKGKGVAIEGGAVLGLMRRIGLRGGSGHSEGVGEGDSLHESEYGPEDEENGENRDEEGVQKGEQESSESDNSSDSDFCVSEDDFDSEECQGFRKDIIKDIRCHVSKHQAYRAKRKALNAIEGKAEDQFDQLWDYAAELRASNPRSTVIMAMTEGDDGTDRRKFEKLYVCFDALRQGFLHGCRPVIGVDGCHLKGPHGGILLTVVSIDPNNNLYPLAYAVVSGETRESWEWFLELLKGDLNVVRDDTYTFISDKQKGLIPAFESVFPAREKPILTMLEWIREFIMTRLSDNRDRARKKWSGKKSVQEFEKIVEKNIDKAADCIPIKSDDWNYEISSYDGSRYVVNLQQHTCTCRKWDLTGIPCNHGMSAICSQSLEPEDFVNPCYSVETFWRYTSMQYFQSMGHSYGPKQVSFHPYLQILEEDQEDHQGQEELSMMNQSTKERRDREKKETTYKAEETTLSSHVSLLWRNRTQSKGL